MALSKLRQVKEQLFKLKEKNIEKDKELAWFERKLVEEKNRREDWKTDKREIEELTQIQQKSVLVLRGLINERYELEQEIKQRLPKILRKWKSRSQYVQTVTTSREQGSQASPETQEKGVMTDKPAPAKPVIEYDCSVLVGFFARW